MPDEVWEGSSENLTAKATGGHVAEHYVVTTEYVNLQSGTLRTEAHQVRLEDIADVDLKQSMTQRAIGKGDVILTVERPGGGRETQKLSSVAEPKKVRDLIGTAIREARERHLETTHYVVQGTAPVPPTVDPAQGDAFTALEKLGKLHDAGVVTDEEFEAKKADLLSHI